MIPQMYQFIRNIILDAEGDIDVESKIKRKAAE